MKRMACLLLLVPLALCGCNGSDGFTPSAELLALAQCTGASLEDLDAVFDDVFDFLGALGGTLPGNVTYDSGTGDFSIATTLGTITGTVSSSDNVDDGIDPGESASASWDLNGGIVAGVSIVGSGVFNASRTSDTFFNVTGAGSVSDGNCLFDGTNLDLDIDLDSSGGPTGSFDFTVTSPDGTITGTMTFDGSSTARVNASFGVTNVTFFIDLDTFVVSF